MIIGLFISVFYFILANKSIKVKTKNLKNTMFLFVSLILPLFAWKLYNVNKSGIVKYDSISYIEILTEAFSSVTDAIHFIVLTLHEIELIFIATYFIFGFYIATFLLLFKPKMSHFYKIKDIYGNNIQKKVALQLCIIYLSASFVITLLITVTHMFGTPMMYGYPSEEYMVFGRYLDPHVPPILLFGIIGIYFTTKLNKKRKLQIYHLVISMTAFVALLVYFTFPTENYKITNMFSICYLQSLTQIIPFSLIILVLSSTAIALFKLTINNKKYMSLLLIFIICYSFFTSFYPYQHQIETSTNTENVNQIGRYLQHESDKHTVILMDRDDFNSFWGNPMWYLTQFWTKGNMIRCSTVNDSSGIKSNCAKTADYILSTKILPYPIESSSKNGYKLYSKNFSSGDKKIPYTIVIGDKDSNFTSNFYEDEIKGETKFRWTKNSSYVILYYPKELGNLTVSIKTSGYRPPSDNAQVTYYINSYETVEMTKESGDNIFSFKVPSEYLNDIYQVMEIRTNTWKPSDYGSLDMRELGVQVEWIKIEQSKS